MSKEIMHHIQMKEGDVGRYVMLPGDPGRVEKIGARFDNPRVVAYNREYKTITGTLDGVPVSVTSTGIGGPSTAIAVEELFFSKNITTGIAVAHARGVILYTAERLQVPVYEYTPMQVKQAVVGYGLAEKQQVMDMTRRLLKMEKMPRPDDAADAIAIALCHARSSTSLLLNRG